MDCLECLNEREGKKCDVDVATDEGKSGMAMRRCKPQLLRTPRIGLHLQSDFSHCLQPRILANGTATIQNCPSNLVSAVCVELLSRHM